MSKTPDFMRPRQQEEIVLPSTITARNVEQAAGTFPCSERIHRYQRRRIREWHRLTREFLRSITVHV
jgi:hypothetical protein